MAAEAKVIGDLEVGAAQAAQAAGLPRMVSVADSAMARFEDPALLSSGKVNIIALDAVVERFGARWPLRRDQVYDHVARTLQKYLGIQGYYLRISETDFLICQPELGRFAGQAACVRYLREILGYFLGEAHLADNCVHQVSKLSSSGVIAARVDARHAEAEAVIEEAERERASAGEHRTMDRWSPFVASDGRQVRVSCKLEPVFELKTYGRIGFRLARRVLVVATEEELSPAAVSALSRADILRIDLATIARGMDRLLADGPGERQPSLIIPVSYTSLSSIKGRNEIGAAFKEASALVQRGVICEICDIEGVPQGALLAAASMIRPFALFVVGRLSAAPPAQAHVSQLKSAGLQAISFECPHGQSENEFLAWAKVSIEAAKRIARSVLVYRTDSARSAGLTALMGATHASVRSDR